MEEIQYLSNIKWLFESWISSSSDQFQINIAVDYIQKLCGVFDKWKKRIWDNDFLAIAEFCKKVESFWTHKFLFIFFNFNFHLAAP